MAVIPPRLLLAEPCMKARAQDVRLSVVPRTVIRPEDGGSIGHTDLFKFVGKADVRVTVWESARRVKCDFVQVLTGFNLSATYAIGATAEATYEATITL